MTRRRLSVVVFAAGLATGEDARAIDGALLTAFAARGHEMLVLVRADQPTPGSANRHYYDSLDALVAFRERIVVADAVIVASDVPDAVRVGAFVHAHAGGIAVFWDGDAARTLQALDADACTYLAVEQIPCYELYLSDGGAASLARIARRYGAPAAHALTAATVGLRAAELEARLTGVQLPGDDGRG